jgi:hypothetical protein
MMQVKDEESLIQFLEDFGLPAVRRGAAPARPAAVVTTPTPAPTAAPTPAKPTPTTASAPRPATTPTPIGFNTTPARPSTPTVVATPTTPVQGTVHYDPGAGYQESVPAHERPQGAPRCFGDYSPKVHECGGCPVSEACQYKLLGIDK